MLPGSGVLRDSEDIYFFIMNYLYGTSVIPFVKMRLLIFPSSSSVLPSLPFDEGKKEQELYSLSPWHLTMNTGSAVMLILACFIGISTIFKNIKYF